jgi:hypothetical protein
VSCDSVAIRNDQALRQQRRVSKLERHVFCFPWLSMLISHFYSLCCTFQTSTGLKGTRKLQGYGGITIASSQGISNSVASVNAGSTEDDTFLLGNSGNSFGNGDAVGTSNGFVTSVLGQAIATGTSGGNSTADTALTVLEEDEGVGGVLSSVGVGQGSAGGNAVFGPSLQAAIAAATPANAPPAPEVVVDTSSKGGKNNAALAAAPAAPTAPAFSFNAEGLPTGGGGGGFGSGSGITLGTVDAVQSDAAEESVDAAYGSALANGFGFGVGSGLAVNNGGEQAGGQGGGTSFGQGAFTFEVDDAVSGAFDNSGVTKSNGGAGAYVGFNPPEAQIFGAFITPPPAATP